MAGLRPIIGRWGLSCKTHKSVVGCASKLLSSGVAMSSSTWDILVLCGASAAITAVICYWAGPIGRVTGLVDEPDGDRRFHAQATPLMGGPAILFPALTASFVCYAKLPFSPIMLFALAASVAAFVIGLLDDRHELSAVLRVGLLTATIIAVLIFDPLFVLHTLAFKIFGLTLSVTVPNTKPHHLSCS